MDNINNTFSKWISKNDLFEKVGNYEMERVTELMRVYKRYKGKTFRRPKTLNFILSIAD